MGSRAWGRGRTWAPSSIAGNDDALRGGSRGFDDGYNEPGGGNIDRGAPKWKRRAGVGAQRATTGQVEGKCSVAEAK